VPGEHNRRNAAAALAALELAGVPLADAEAAIVEFRGAGRRLEPRGEAGGVQVLDDYAHHPAELAATISAARELTNGRLVVLFQPHLFSRTLYLARDFAEALAAADAVCITDIYAAREEPIPGVTGKLLVDRLCERRPGMPVGWAPTPASAVELIAAQARPGGIVITAGAGDVDAAIPALLEALR
jgi:UDP-N-acetylmuramate--alanine ligase